MVNGQTHLGRNQNILFLDVTGLSLILVSTSSTNNPVLKWRPSLRKPHVLLKLRNGSVKKKKMNLLLRNRWKTFEFYAQSLRKQKKKNHLRQFKLCCKQSCTAVWLWCHHDPHIQQGMGGRAVPGLSVLLQMSWSSQNSVLCKKCLLHATKYTKDRVCSQGTISEVSFNVAINVNILPMKSHSWQLNAALLLNLVCLSVHQRDYLLPIHANLSNYIA